MRTSGEVCLPCPYALCLPSPYALSLLCAMMRDLRLCANAVLWGALEPR
jgi:hypothetical protein